jgi:hypothetical protein
MARGKSSLATSHSSLATLFLIANARLELDLNRRKESLLRISNRKWMPFSQMVTPFTRRRAIACPPRRAGHDFPWPQGLAGPDGRLIYGAAIRNAPKALKT